MAFKSACDVVTLKGFAQILRLPLINQIVIVERSTQSCEPSTR
jgi:hypothetical protein